MTKKQLSMNDTSFKTSLMEKIAYGMGDTACNVVFAITSSLIVYFYTNVIGMSAALVGTILLVSRVFDGISDLLIAQIVDKVNSPKGKARAWILWMAAPYGIASVLMFCVPPHSSTMVQAIYVFITYNLCTTGVYTALNLPYSNLAPMMTRNDDDLAKLNLFRMAMSPIGNLIVTALTLPFINMLGGGQKAWITVCAVYSIVAFFMLLFCYKGCQERFHTDAAKEAEAMPFAQRLKATLKNKYFIVLTLTMMAVALYQNVNGTVATYYAQYMLNNVEIMGVMQSFENIPKIIAIICLAPFIKKFGKRNLVLAGAILTMVAQLTLLAVPANPAFVAAVAAIRGIGKAPLFGCVFTMMADVVNYGHWKTGVRVQALIFSAATVGQKFGGGITGAIIGQLMDKSGFTGLAQEIPSAVAMVENLYIWGTVFAWAIIIGLMLAYKLEKNYDGMIRDMENKGMLKQAD